MRNIKVSVLVTALAMGLAATACGDAATPQIQAQDDTAVGLDAGLTSTDDMAEDTDAFDKLVTPVTTVVSGADPSEPTVVLDDVVPTVGPTDDPFGPLPGEEIGVIGVASDDVLNVRAGPGVDEPITATLDPMAVVAGTGRHLQLPDGAYWWEITTGAATGWANSFYLSRLSDPVDLSGIDTTLVADTLTDLGKIVVDGYRANLDPESTVTMTVAPRGEHDLGEVVYDITGSGDDSVSGVRLHVYARPTDDRQAFQLQRVEVTTMCWRGVYQGGCA